jgi:hypothetical protein
VNLPLKTALLLVSAASAAVAQARPLSDSVMALNRAGRWEQAGQLAVASMRTASDVEERCALLVGGLYASSRMFQFTNGPRQLKTFDDMCGKTTTATRLAHEIEGLRRDLQLPPMPPTGVDWSAIDQFWMAVDTLSRGIEPSFAQWRALMITPGYRIAAISYPTIARAIDIALRPSRRAERDSVLRRSSLDSAVVAHVLVAAASREELVRFRTALEPAVRDTIAYAVKNTSRFLPPNSVDHAPPLVTFAIFASDGFSQEPGIVLDLYHARENGFADFLSHEFHHSFASKLDRTTAGPGAADGRLFHAIRQLKNEGIPDMLDKAAHPLVTSPGMRWYADSYNAAYDKTPATLKVLDSLLVAGSDSAKMVDAGNRAQGLLVYGSHPNGAYMAHTILDAFGRDSLIATIPSVFAFIRMYESAEAKRGNPSPFSAAGHAALSAMESRHMKP